MVRNWLEDLDLIKFTTHEDRLKIDKTIEERKGVYCDDVIKFGAISQEEFEDIVYSIIGHKIPENKKKLLIIR